MALTLETLRQLKDNIETIEIDVGLAEIGEYSMRINDVDVTKAVDKVIFDFGEEKMDIEWRPIWMVAQQVIDDIARRQGREQG